jgi:hypothetical protein
MTGESPSPICLHKHDARTVLGMDARGDRTHDIAAWFGVNQARIAEVRNGCFGEIEAAPAGDLPPSGPPGIKGRRIRAAAEAALGVLAANSADPADMAAEILRVAISKYDTNEH